MARTCFIWAVSYVNAFQTCCILPFVADTFYAYHTKGIQILKISANCAARVWSFVQIVHLLSAVWLNAHGLNFFSISATETANCM